MPTTGYIENEYERGEIRTDSGLFFDKGNLFVDARFEGFEGGASYHKTDAQNSAAINKAIAFAYHTVLQDGHSPKAVRVVLPFAGQGYRASNIALKSFVRFGGFESHVRIINEKTDGTDCIVGDGTQESLGRIRETGVENVRIEAVSGSGHGILLQAFQGATVRNVQVNGAATSSGIRGERNGTAFADDLSIENAWVDGCDKGLSSDSNAHAWSVSGRSVFLNNTTYNVDVSCDGFNMYGGEVTSHDGNVGARMWNCNGGGFWGTHFEMINGGGTLVVLGDVTDGAVRGFDLNSCNLTSFGTAASKLVHIKLGKHCVVRGGHMDGNSAFDITGVTVDNGSVKCGIDNPYFEDNVGAGNLIPWTDASGQLWVRQGRAYSVIGSQEIWELERVDSAGASVSRLVALPSGAPNDWFFDIEGEDGNVIYRNLADEEVFSVLGRAPSTVPGIAINGIHVLSGTGDPEGVVTAPAGSLFLRTNGASGSSLYSKATGSGNTGWEAR